MTGTVVRDRRLLLRDVVGLLELYEGRLQARGTLDREDRRLLTTALKSGRAVLGDLLELIEERERRLALAGSEAPFAKLSENIVEPPGGDAVFSEAHSILIVEDAPELLSLLRRLIMRMGYEALTASDGRAALNILSERRVDLVLTDWAMPYMNGGELIRAMKRDQRLREIPTIVLTGHDTDVERREASVAGADCFMLKPVNRQDLQQKIAELLKAGGIHYNSYQ